MERCGHGLEEWIQGPDRSLEVGQSTVERSASPRSTRNRFRAGARRATLAALQTQYQQVFTEKERLTAELTQLQASNTQMNQTLNQTQTELKRVTDSNEKIIGQLNATIADRNTNQRKVGKLTDEVNEKTVLLETLEKRIKDLTDSFTLAEARLINAQNILVNAGIKVSTKGGLPNDLRGEVLAVGNKGMVEISLGRDDGVSQGDQLEVYRGSQYLGRIEVSRTEDDKRSEASSLDFARERFNKVTKLPRGSTSRCS